MWISYLRKTWENRQKKNWEIPSRGYHGKSEQNMGKSLGYHREILDKHLKKKKHGKIIQGKSWEHHEKIKEISWEIWEKHWKEHGDIMGNLGNESN